LRAGGLRKGRLSRGDGFSQEASFASTSLFWIKKQIRLAVQGMGAPPFLVATIDGGRAHVENISICSEYSSIHHDYAVHLLR
jgi:hypothetical protein